MQCTQMFPSLCQHFDFSMQGVPGVITLVIGRSPHLLATSYAEIFHAVYKGRMWYGYRRHCFSHAKLWPVVYASFHTGNSIASFRPLTGSKAHGCCRKPARLRPTLSMTSRRPLTSTATSRLSPWSYGPLPAWRGCIGGTDSGLGGLVRHRRRRGGRAVGLGAELIVTSS
jgi:hypothetical protein